MSKGIMEDINVTTNEMSKDFNASSILINDDINNLSSNFNGVVENMGINWGDTLNTNFTNVQTYVDEVSKKFDAIPKDIETIHTIRTYRVEGSAQTPTGGVSGGSGGGGIFSSIIKTIKKWVGLQSGGDILRSGLAYVHKGETVIPTNKKSEVTLNVTYNIQVHDKYEMEKLLRDNNLKLVEEVKRQINI
jgi:hypothetical protein